MVTAQDIASWFYDDTGAYPGVVDRGFAGGNEGYVVVIIGVRRLCVLCWTDGNVYANEGRADGIYDLMIRLLGYLGLYRDCTAGVVKARQLALGHCLIVVGLQEFSDYTAFLIALIDSPSEGQYGHNHYSPDPGLITPGAALRLMLHVPAIFRVVIFHSLLLS
ncbi:hypothetical protein MBAV_005065 [Candidatus Magnetobacterium bavaricum]|uniref:Uncharacterized protein n=1 Tax=Candidatus Magnetobacterium bavaricum TaxID=29290 RepID=A0A0F3GLL3_9BACT|nr:hypothetical protein MBAV_005065 [Candidatus Magnetobacterium bavaricum]